MGRKIEDEADARRCLSAAESSNETRRDWARRHGIDARSLNGWRVALDKRAAKHAKHQPLRLLEVVTPESQAVERPSIALSVCGVDVWLPAGFSERELLSVLRAVRAAC